MVGHVDDCWLVGNSVIKDNEVILIIENIGHLGCHLSWEAIVSIRADDLEGDAGAVGLHNVIYLILPAGRTAVQRVAVIVFDEVILYAIEGELALIDAVGKTSDGSTEVGWCPAVEVGI